MPRLYLFLESPACQAFNLSGSIQEVGKVKHEQIVKGGFPEGQQSLLKSNCSEGLPVEDPGNNRASLNVQDAHPEQPKLSFFFSDESI